MARKRKGRNGTYFRNLTTPVCRGGSYIKQESRRTLLKAIGPFKLQKSKRVKARER